MKSMIVKSKIKQKSKAILGMIRNLVLNFILYFVTAYIYYMRKYQGNRVHRVKHQIHYESLEELSKKIL